MSQLVALLQEMSQTASAKGGRFLSTPPEAYTSEELLQLERKRVLRKGWMCVGRFDEFEAEGAYRTDQIDATPILVVGQGDGTVKAFANVCRHRLMVVADGHGISKEFSCRYHGWTYAIDGTLVSTPSMPRGFSKQSHGLNELRTEIWLGFVFVNLDPEAKPLGPDLKELANHLGEYHLDRFRIMRHDTLVARCNWKIAVENGLETYHLTATHGETLAPLAPAKNVRMRPANAKFQLYDHLLADDVEIPQEMPENFIGNREIGAERKRLSVVGGIYPSMVYVVGFDWAWWISCQPISVNEVRIDHGMCAPYDLKGEAPDPENPAYYFLHLDTAFVPEDIPRIEGVQRGAESGAGAQCELHELELPINGFLRYLVTQLGAE